MLTLDNDLLRFSFPEIAAQLGIHIERHIENILPNFLPSEPKPVASTRSSVGPTGRPRFQLVNPRRIRRTLGQELWTPSEVEEKLRACIHRLSGLKSSTLDTLTIDFQRTLRLPDDGNTYPLPAGIGQFPLRSVDDFDDAIPDVWRNRGGVMLPLHQSEALWIRFSSKYPFAVKVGAGKINAVSGEPWGSDLPIKPQGYIVSPEQPWLDGFSVGEGTIRQFVAMPLGSGYSVEEQVTGKADIGGIQLQVHPMKADFYFREIIAPLLPMSLAELQRISREYSSKCMVRYSPRRALSSESMGLGAGGKMRQEIYADPHPISAWDQTQSRRCFVHLANSTAWRQITGESPPHPPFTAKEYKLAGMPWFDYYRDDLAPLPGSKQLAGIKSVDQINQKKEGGPSPKDLPLKLDRIIQHGNSRRPGDIREFLDTP